MSLLPASSLVDRAREGAERAFVAEGPALRCGPEDRFHDYVLGEYAPLAPHEGKLRSVNLLFESFALLGVEREGRGLVERVIGALGPFRTVWGIKQVPGTGLVGWELYFYDFERTHADLAIGRVREALAGAIAIDAEEPRPLPWHMWSVEISPAHLRREQAASIDVYVDMRSYKIRGKACAFENVYTFHDPRADIDAVLHRLRSSFHFDERRGDLRALMPPSLFRCGRVCVANKRAADAMYFSRIGTRAARAFVAANGYPRAMARFFEAHEAELSHLLWDVGVDFRGDDGPLRVTKTSVYGSF
jgi:hypothetical protein